MKITSLAQPYLVQNPYDFLLRYLNRDILKAVFFQAYQKHHYQSIIKVVHTTLVLYYKSYNSFVRETGHMHVVTHWKV